MNTTTASRAWTRQRDDYGRSVHALHNGRGTVGVVVKHPLLKSGEHGAYWYCRWDLPYGSPREQVVANFRTLNEAKAALAEVTA